MGRGSAGVGPPAGDDGMFAAIKDRASAWGSKAGAAGAVHFDPSRRDASVIAFFVFWIYLCGYFCWFAAMQRLWTTDMLFFWNYLPGYVHRQFKLVLAGSFIAAFTALPLCPLVALRSGTIRCLSTVVQKWVVIVLCAVHGIGVLIFVVGMCEFIKNDNEGTPTWADDPTPTAAEKLGYTTRQVLMPWFSSTCLAYICVTMVAQREVPTLPFTVTLSLMTFWLYLTAFFVDFAKKDGASAASVAVGSFFAAFTAPAATAVTVANRCLPSWDAASRGAAVLALTALHGAGYFIFFCGACSWLHGQFSGQGIGFMESTNLTNFFRSKNLADVTLYLFMPSFFSLYFLSRAVRQGRALRGGYESVEGTVAIGATNIGDADL